MSSDDYVILDIETTGLSKYIHNITEIAAVRMNKGKIVEEFQTLVNPGEHIPSFITRLTGIDDEMVKDAPDIKEALPKFLDFLGSGTIIAHNATFDYGFISYHAEKHLDMQVKNERICTRRLANRLLPDLGSKKLASLCECFNVKNEQAHRAMGDVKATTEIYKKFLKLMKLYEVETKEDIIKFQSSKIIRYIVL